MKKICKIVNIEVKKESSIFIKSSGRLEQSIYPPLHGIKNMGWKYINLFIIDSDFKSIKKDDYVLLPSNRIIQVEEKCNALGYTTMDEVAFLYLPKSTKKILATSDNYLDLPQLSYEFIEKYITSYNMGNIITDVVLEYNLKNNKIGKIDICKQYWNRDEHISDIKRIIELYSTTYNGGNINKWIDSNLIE